MKKTKNNKSVFILYQYDNFKNDFIYLKEYYNTSEILKDNNIKLKNKNSIYHFIKKEISDNLHLLNDRYLIIKEDL